MTIHIFKLKITISYLFCALIAFLLFFDKSGIFALALLAVFIHESGHLLMMKLLKQMPDEIHLMPAGVTIIRRKKSLNYKEDMMVASGGIVFNVLFTVILIFLYKFQILQSFCMKLAVINIFIAAFNMLPINGLDGYDILYAFLNRKKDHAILVFWISTFTIVLILGLGVALFYYYFNPTLIITALYLVILTFLNFRR